MLQVSADESTDRGGTLKFLFTIVDLHEFGTGRATVGQVRGAGIEPCLCRLVTVSSPR